SRDVYHFEANENPQLRVCDDDDDLHGSLGLLLGKGLQSWRLRGMDSQGRSLLCLAETDHKEFHVRDSLVFEYDPNINDVTHKLEVLVIHDPLRPVPLPTPSKFLSVGKTYKVRVSEGWKVYDNDFYNKWSEEKQFHVGDSLIFEYTNEVNDFYEINGDLEFMTCDPTSPVAVHKTRHDPVRLTEPRVHYFITSQSGYCEVGLKL
ncbi:hypothetical protein HID58_026197, partial [Brassica napus]